MGYMKANKKYILEEDEGVSAVIGVILMVAITVAIAATVYVYVSGMMGEGQETAPTLTFTRSVRTLTVSKADQGATWGEFWLSNTTASGNTMENLITFGDDVKISAGQQVVIPGSETTTVALIHNGTNSLMTTWTFN
jgi:flagellin-like protein